MRQLVCLSHEPWLPSPTRTQQLLTRLKDVSILFFEPYTGRRAHKQLGRRVRPNITVYTLPPHSDSVLLRQASLRRQKRFLNKVLQKHRFQEPALWLNSPESVFFTESFPRSGLIYDCSREWDELPLDWESELALRSDVIFAASPGLVQRLSPCCDNIALIPNGVNYTLFSHDDTGERPSVLSGCTGPILARVGAVTSDLELEPLLFAAAAHPDWTFLMIGPVDDEARAALTRFPNIHLAGRVPMVDVPDHLSCCHVCFDLLSQNTKGHDILPVRLYEYLATGKPVVLMLVPDQVEPFPDVVYTASDPASFLRRCERALEEDPTWVRDRRKVYAQDAQWARRAGEIQHILEAAALL